MVRSPIGAEIDGVSYWFEKTPMGDIVSIHIDGVSTICSFYYDAWGSVTKGTLLSYPLIEEFIPFRYRGYVYDNETGLYYLNSRYYDPVTSRFVNADGYVSTGTGLMGYNMFSYCNNNPVSMVDPTGEVGEVACIGLIAGAYIGMSILSSQTSSLQKDTTPVPLEPIPEPVPTPTTEPETTYETVIESAGATSGFYMPIEGGVIKNDYPYYPGTTKNHQGTDIEADEGTPVHSVVDGIVTGVYTSINFNTYQDERYQGTDTYGMYIKIYSEAHGVTMFYAHLSAVNVSLNQQVKAWDVIGLSGNTGNSSAPHLHFEVRIGSTPVSPYDYLP